MQQSVDETVGVDFNVDLLQAARDKTLDVIVEAANLVRPGMTEAEARKLVKDIQAAKGSLTSWHAPQIRFGENTILNFGTKPVAEATLRPDDIFFFDLGPIFNDHEGDVGRAFTVGDDVEMIRCRRDVEEIWDEVRSHWSVTGATGTELYAFAERCAAKRHWVLSLDKANGHRIADFPHAAHARGSIEGFTSHPAPNRWILEIQIRHPSRPFGAFYEDLLK